VSLFHSSNHSNQDIKWVKIYFKASDLFQISLVYQFLNDPGPQNLLISTAEHPYILLTSAGLVGVQCLSGSHWYSRRSFIFIYVDSFCSLVHLVKAHQFNVNPTQLLGIGKHNFEEFLAVIKHK